MATVAKLTNYSQTYVLLLQRRSAAETTRRQKVYPLQLVPKLRLYWQRLALPILAALGTVDWAGAFVPHKTHTEHAFNSGVLLRPLTTETLGST